MKIVTCMGGAWRLNEENYKKLLIAISKDDGFNLNEYGRQLTSEIINITDMSAKEAKELLETGD